MRRLDPKTRPGTPAPQGAIKLNQGGTELNRRAALAALALPSAPAWLGACSTPVPLNAPVKSAVASGAPSAVVNVGYKLAAAGAANAGWRKLSTAEFKGKQDDIVFATPTRGWYGNGDGKIYRTDDAGATWVQQLSQPGTFFRCFGFVDAQRGYAGNIGTDYFPGVTDTTPLYETRDGGTTWKPVTGLQGPAVKGLCAIDILRSRFINAGNLDERVVIHAAGRVGGPAFLMRSLDGGATWRTMDLSAQAGPILDVKFFDEANGLLMCGSDAATERGNALILRTQDGGVTWQKAYQSNRPFEITWKASFPTRDVGYVTVQNYNPDKSIADRVVVKTTDGGRTWKEMPLVSDHAVRQFGVGFVNPQEGWVGTTTGGFETRDGGQTWQKVNMGRYSNKIRIVPSPSSPGGFNAYAIGVDVWKYDAAST
jgi:photosystem II stability/assembly factor-like uncharacterized protein